jgi:hypothetical protein
MAVIRGRKPRHDEDRYRRGRQPGRAGCLWFALIFLIAMLMLSLMFGGFRKGHLHPNGLRPGPVVACVGDCPHPGFDDLRA